MRLDRLLVIKGYFSSRQKAKEAIRRRFVIVNGKVVTKPSYDVDFDVEIRVLQEEKPKGYWKLKELDEMWNLIKKDDIVLDLGSSAGGFLLYASEKAERVYGIEYSREFEDKLKEIERERDNVKIFIADAFTFDLSELEPVDVILSDLTLKPSYAWKATKRFIPLLKPQGRVLFVAKTGVYNEEIDFSPLKVVDWIDSKDRKERYYLLKI
ncbi:S4 domain-containing protein [Archaeoglobus profundus]|uniref:RNA-binding S4 domain protein n=1 Tax=Archaeoglobus profundus (strain DSM 5631 / JCM 9629 / NBRC 100127 / Av18) TaxID=572546 RepID=D2RHD3_ARCPA|nr:S4 domain-containing protein [Archaeoglobus profundus]ADB57708.1 RNA-binding S4 domain protein [Archaeoglobus profundus DSM 5631]